MNLYAFLHLPRSRFHLWATNFLACLFKFILIRWNAATRNNNAEVDTSVGNLTWMT